MIKFKNHPSMRLLRNRSYLLIFAATLALVSASVGWAQEGKVVRATVHSVALERNVTGESADRRVSVYLPPSYESSTKRYPVIYLLHGIGDTDETWTSPWVKGAPWQSVPDARVSYDDWRYYLAHDFGSNAARLTKLIEEINEAADAASLAPVKQPAPAKGPQAKGKK